jgi:hypothetical protein
MNQTHQLCDQQDGRHSAENRIQLHASCFISEKRMQGCPSDNAEERRNI